MMDIEAIRKDPDNQDWVKISHDEILSEDFMREFQDKVFWNIISWKQKLSENFIKEFQDKIDFYKIEGIIQFMGYPCSKLAN